MSEQKPVRCSHIERCALYPLFSLQSSIKVWQTFYCLDKFENCVRFQRSSRGETVDPQLLPDGSSLAASR